MAYPLSRLKENSLEIERLKCISFEYLLAGVAKEYSSIEGYTSTKDFNKFNNLSIGKALVYPFFVAVSNGYSESLYTLFGNFISSSFGPAAISIYDLADKAQPTLSFFRLQSNQNKTGIEVIKTDEFTSFEKLKQAIKNFVILRDEGTEIKFSETSIEGDSGGQKTICDAIDNGIDLIREKFDKTFFEAERKTIVTKAKYFSAFKRLYFQDKSEIIDYKEIKEDKNRIFSTKLAF